MGRFFSNIHIKKNDNFTIDELRKFLADDMSSKGYKQLENEDNSEISLVIYFPENSKWISVASDAFNFNDDKDTREVIEPVSKNFETDVIAMSCMDSDYAFMHLINYSQNVDGWVNLGELYDGMKLPRRTSASQWKKIVNDMEKFKAIVKEKEDFAEDLIYSSAELMEMDTEQCDLEPDETDLIDKNCFVKLYFSMPEGKEKLLPNFIIDIHDRPSWDNYPVATVFANNIGGRSKGIEIIFVGDYIENDDVIIYDATFESNYGSEKCKIVPIEFKKAKMTNGETCLFWRDSSFQIPPAVNQKLPYIKRMKLEFEKAFGIRFYVKGNRDKFNDIKLYLIPIENRKGSDSWCPKEHPKKCREVY